MGRAQTILALTVALAGSGLPAGARSQALARPPAARGIALGLFASEPDARYAPLLDEIVAQGATHVSLVVVWYQETIRSQQIRPRPGYSAPDEVLRATIAQAKARGLEVMLFPIVGIEVRAAKEWRGKISPPSWDAWFASYRSYLLHMAAMAREGNVAVLGVGSELLSTEGMRDRWVALIDQVRSQYPGQLLYSANWDHFEPVTFWDRVDLMGVTGYYELSTVADPSLAALVEAWRRWKQPLIAFANKQRRTLVFTEIGYPSLDGANMYPWDETRRAPIDLEEQALCYRAFVASWDGEPSLAGVYFWNWFGRGGVQDGDYTPRGKPAVQIIRSWYHGAPSRAPQRR